jgi:hypothetical protein
MKPSVAPEVFYHIRHGEVVREYLAQYRYLLVLDSDNLIVNMSKSLDHIVNTIPNTQMDPFAKVDLFFHMREGGEVTASTYFIRNSAFSRCFIDYWRSMAPSDELLRQANMKWIQTPNNDNGDLIAALMNFINPDIALKCSSLLRNHSITTQFDRHRLYDNKILLCFRLFRGALVDTSNHSPQIKIFFIREDFFRMHTGHTMTKENLLLRKDAYCHKNDIIVHGWKELGSQYWPQTPAALRDGNSDKGTLYPSCNLETIKSGQGGNTRCRWLNYETELEIVKKHCYWRSPLCKNHTAHWAHGTKKIYDNICLQDDVGGRGTPTQCWSRERFNLMRWTLCLEHSLCDPYISIVQIRNKYMTMYSLSGAW